MKKTIQTIIIRETPAWMAVNKPPGISVERQPGANDTLEDLIMTYLSGQNRKPYLGIVHRLDRPTSGILLLAKKKSALAELHEFFRTGKVQKTYLAVSANAPETLEGELQHWLFKDQEHKKARVVPPGTPGAVSARLRYEILQQKPGAVLWEIRLLTGKFHQIRAQLSAIGCPIIGDVLYDGASLPGNTPVIALHAWQLQFPDPESREILRLEAPLPDLDIWKMWKKYTDKQ